MRTGLQPLFCVFLLKFSILVIRDVHDQRLADGTRWYVVVSGNTAVLFVPEALVAVWPFAYDSVIRPRNVTKLEPPKTGLFFGSK